MGRADGEPESKADASERRLEFAIEALRVAFQQKHGNVKSHGIFSVSLQWQAGEIAMVEVGDGTTYR